jgi:hypothetical protein
VDAVVDGASLGVAGSEAVVLGSMVGLDAAVTDGDALEDPEDSADPADPADPEGDCSAQPAAVRAASTLRPATSGRSRERGRVRG